MCPVNEKKDKQQLFSLQKESEAVSIAKNIDRIAVVGVGTVGASWATIFLAKGYTVNLYDISKDILEQAVESIEKNLKFLKKHSLIHEDVQSILDRIYRAPDLASSADNADYVQESVSEKLEVKQTVFARLDSICSESVVIASSSSGLLIGEIQKSTKNPQRCIIAHPFNPPHLMPLVELVPGDKTSERTVQIAYHFYLNMGKVPLRVKKEVPGHIANRLCAALWREAIDLVSSGVASVKDVDLAISAGPGIRWALMGPHLSYHLGGGRSGIEGFIKHIGPAFETWWRSMNNLTSISPSTAEKIIEGVREEAGMKSIEELCEWRDEKIIGILKAISEP